MLEIETNWYKRTMNKIRIRRVFFRCYLSSKSTRVLVKCVQKRTPSLNRCLNFTKLSNESVVSMLICFISSIFRYFRKLHQWIQISLFIWHLGHRHQFHLIQCQAHKCHPLQQFRHRKVFPVVVHHLEQLESAVFMHKALYRHRKSNIKLMRIYRAAAAKGMISKWELINFIVKYVIIIISKMHSILFLDHLQFIKHLLQANMEKRKIVKAKRFDWISMLVNADACTI